MHNCHLCQSKFTRRSSLTRHLSALHKVAAKPALPVRRERHGKCERKVIRFEPSLVSNRVVMSTADLDVAVKSEPDSHRTDESGVHDGGLYYPSIKPELQVDSVDDCSAIDLSIPNKDKIRISASSTNSQPETESRAQPPTFPAGFIDLSQVGVIFVPVPVIPMIQCNPMPVGEAMDLSVVTGSGSRAETEKSVLSRPSEGNAQIVDLSSSANKKKPMLKRSRSKASNRPVSFSDMNGNYDKNVRTGNTGDNINNNNSNTEKTVECPDCGKNFATEALLRRHANRAHVKERPFGCVQCGKCFLDERSLKRHVVAHGNSDGENPIASGKTDATDSKSCTSLGSSTPKSPPTCPICRRQFSAGSSLRNHMRIHTGEKPFRCKECNQCFAESGNLSSHMRTHTGEKPYKCRVCKKNFAQSSYMRLHMRLHTGEKPLTCILCNETFCWSNTLRVHMQTHAGVKPHACHLCDRRFSDFWMVRRHLKSGVCSRKGTRGYEGTRAGQLLSKPMPSDNVLSTSSDENEMRTELDEDNSDSTDEDRMDEGSIDISHLSAVGDDSCQELELDAELGETAGASEETGSAIEPAANPESQDVSNNNNNDDNNTDDDDCNYSIVHIDQTVSEEPLPLVTYSQTANGISAYGKVFFDATGKKIIPSRVCPICGRTFSRPARVLRHMCTHTGERPFACPVCDKRFMDATSLRKHGKIHARSTAAAGASSRNFSGVSVNCPKIPDESKPVEDNKPPEAESKQEPAMCVDAASHSTSVTDAE